MRVEGKNRMGDLLIMTTTIIVKTSSIERLIDEIYRRILTEEVNYYFRLAKVA